MTANTVPNLYRYTVDSLTVDAGTGAVTTRYTLTAGIVVDNSSGGGLALGETSTTAYRGDRGKAAYDHSQVTSGNPHGTTAADVGALTQTAADARYDAAGAAASAVAALSSVYQPLDSDLTAIAALSTTTFGRSLLALADAASLRSAAGLGTAATAASSDFQPADSDLTAIAALSTTTYGRSLLALADAAAGRTALGLGTAATAATGDFQPVDSDLTAIAALSTTTFGRSLLTAADAAALRTDAGLGTAAVKDTGTGSTNVILGNDSRLTDARTPSLTPWRIEILPWMAQPSTVSGTFNFSADSSSIGGGYANTGSTQDQTWTWSVLLGAGTWTIDILHRQNSANGVGTVLLDGAAVGTFDNYAASLTRNTRSTFTGVTVATTAVLPFVIHNTAAKNGSSSGYLLAIHAIHFRRTA